MTCSLAHGRVGWKRPHWLGDVYFFVCEMKWSVIKVLFLIFNLFKLLYQKDKKEVFLIPWHRLLCPSVIVEGLTYNVFYCYIEELTIQYAISKKNVKCYLKK